MSKKMKMTDRERALLAAAILILSTAAILLLLFTKAGLHK